VKVVSGTNAQHLMCSFQSPNAHTHAHSRNSKRLGKAGRRGAALYKAWNAASSSSAHETGRDIIAYKGKTSGSYGSSCLPVPALAAQRRCMHDPLRMPCPASVHVRAACVRASTSSSTLSALYVSFMLHKIFYAAFLKRSRRWAAWLPALDIQGRAAGPVTASVNT
jgi:hypothetical protein